MTKHRRPASSLSAAEDRKVWLKAEAARRIATDPTTPHQKHLLFCCLERYIKLTTEQQAEYAQLVQESNQYQEVRAMAVTTYEKGIEKGRQEATNLTMRRVVLTQLHEKFPRVPAKLRKRVETLSEDELMALMTRILKASSLDDLEL